MKILAVGSNNINLERVCRILIIVGVALTPFASFQTDWIPTPIKMFLGYENLLSMYPLLAFSIIWLIHNLRRGKWRSYIPLLGFFVIYFLVNIAIVIHGDLIFPYYEYADYSQLKGGNRVAFLVVSRIFPSNSQQANWIISNILKSCLTLTTQFVASYFVLFSMFLFYKETKFGILDDVWLGISAILPVIFVYEIFEFAYLVGFKFGAVALSRINPLLYEVGSAHGWWPPLYWNQVRSVFAEPSYFSYWLACCLPLFMNNIQKGKKRILNSLELLFVSFLGFASNSRTGAALVFGVVAVYLILGVFGLRKNVFLSAIAIIIVICIAFVLGSVFVAFAGDSSGFAISSYLDNTIFTLANESARSNEQRYASMNVQMAIFRNQPVLGVSEQLLGMYEYDEFSRMNLDNNELNLWMDTQMEYGALECGFPRLCEYTATLATGGILGFAVNNLPIVLLACLLFLLQTFKRTWTSDGITGIALCAAVVAFGISNQIEINFIYFVIIAAMLVELGKRGENG